MRPVGCKAFCQETSIHGLKYVGGEKSFLRKTFWILSLLGLFCTSCWFLLWYVDQYTSNSVTTTIDTTSASLTEVFFPSVTVCNVNQVKKSFLASLGLSSKQFGIFEREFITGRSPTDANETDELKDISQRLRSAEVQEGFVNDLAKAFGLPVAVVNDSLNQGLAKLEQGISRMAVQIEPGDIIPYVSYKGKETILKVAAYVGTDFGVCAEIIPYVVQETSIFGVQSNGGDLSHIEPGVTNGEPNGLVLLLDAEVYDHADRSSRAAGAGFKIALHHHRDVAVMQQMGFNVAPGKIVNVALTPVLTTTTSSAKTRFGPDRRDCYFEDEIQLRHWPYNFTDTFDVSKRGQSGRYSITNCMLEAALQAVEKECHCSPSFHPLGFDLEKHQTCRGAGIYCFKNILSKMGDIDTIDDDGELKRCKAPCVDQTNEFKLNFLEYPNRNTFIKRREMCLIVKNLRQRCRSSIKAGLLEVHYPELCGALQELESDIGTKLCNETTWMALPLEQVANQALVTTLTENLYKYGRENLVLMNVYVQNPYVTRLKRDEAFPAILFVAGLGGLLGVFTGFSFVSAVEFFYHLAEWFYQKMCWGQARRAASTYLTVLR